MIRSSSASSPSFNRPGGNATGIHVFLQAMEAKRLGLLRELVPTAAIMAALVNPTNAASQLQMKDVEDAARALGVQMHTLNAINEQDKWWGWVMQVAPSGWSACWRSRPQQERLSLGWQLELPQQERQAQEPMP
jgi:hypothetical protein